MLCPSHPLPATRRILRPWGVAVCLMLMLAGGCLAQSSRQGSPASPASAPTNRWLVVVKPTNLAGVAQALLRAGAEVKGSYRGPQGSNTGVMVFEDNNGPSGFAADGVRALPGALCGS